MVVLLVIIDIDSNILACVTLNTFKDLSTWNTIAPLLSYTCLGKNSEPPVCGILLFLLSLLVP